MLRQFFTLLALVSASALSAQAIWTDVTERDLHLNGERRIVPQVYRSVRADFSALQTLLNTAPDRFSGAPPLEFTLPMPDGSAARFQLTSASVMAPALQQRFPEIRSFTGAGIDDPTALLKCDVTPWGFHAMILSASQNTVFIDPYIHGDTEYYVVYFKKDYASKKAHQFSCAVEGASSENPEGFFPGAGPQLQGDCKLRKYRLALACTAEYSSFHGNTVPLVLAAFNTSLNRINGVYERETAVTMELVANTDTLIFFNASSDPYSNNNGGAMLDQNQATCNARIGSANYDIGHVFSTGGGGIAQLGSVCNSGSKAMGVTGGPSPIGDPFDIDYVAHEMGHQYGANHSFNNSCSNNINNSTAMEPGSGSTIMSYAGICAPNVQNQSDDYFHAINLQEIGNFITGSGNGCAVKITTGNNAPTVEAGLNRTIPRSTPFALTAVGSDPDGNAATYCWEQMDQQTATMPPAATNTVGPMFRSFDPVPSPTRYFPRLQDIVNNANPTWERLPSVGRNMKFRVTVRDNYPGAGCTEEDDLTLTVSGTAGPFLVTEPNTNVLWYVGEAKTVTWNVASTDIAPVNCAAVRLLLSTDGGYTYPVVLADNEPNDGSATITVPNNISNTCRVMVQSVGNVFFDISNQNFRIQLPPAPTFLLEATSATAATACAGDSVVYTLNVNSILGFNNPVAFSLSGAPAGASLSFSTDTLTPAGTLSITLSGITPDMAGVYAMTLSGVSDTLEQTLALQLTALPGIPAGTALSSPSDGAVNQETNVQLSWSSAQFADSYILQVATSPAFTPASLVFNQTVSSNSSAVSGLQNSAVYYWRVLPKNFCGESAFTGVWAFQTALKDCNQTYNSSDVPKTINPNTVNTITSNLNISDNRILSDVDVSVDVNHSWVGDLKITLIAPGGAQYTLLDRPGVPADTYGCEGDNLDLIFDDAALLTAATLEGTCDNNPAIGGSFQPIAPLAALNGSNISGQWRLSITDNFADDGGSLTAWGLSFCFNNETPTSSLQNNPLLVDADSSENIASANLFFSVNDTLHQGVYVLLSLPQHGTIHLNGMPLGVGDSFTQADVDAGLVTYIHSGDNAPSDQFQFDVVDATTGAWLHNNSFQIQIIQYQLSVSLQVVDELLCYTGSSGVLEVTASGSDTTYMYSLNGGSPQSQAIFTGLVAGEYTVLVTDANGVSALTNQVTLVAPAPIDMAAATSDNDLVVTASGGTGVIDLFVLEGPVTLSQTSGVFDNLPNGTYTVTVFDDNGCGAITEATIAYSDLAASLAASAPVNCQNTSSGAVLATATAGFPPYEYSLNGGSYQTAPLFENLPEGDYSVTVRDSQDFTYQTNGVLLTAPEELLVSATVDQSDITVAAAGGNGTFEYSLDGESFQTDPVFSEVANGVYTVIVRDELGCTASTTVIVAVNGLLALAEIEQDVLCYDGTEGSIVVWAAGGEEPLEYSLDGGETFQSAEIFSDLPAGTYSVTVRDAQGFTTTSNTLILENPEAISASLSVSYNTITIMANGGTGDLDYSVDGVVFQAENIFSNLANGSYFVTVRDANGCTVTWLIDISVPILEVPSIIVTDTLNTPCIEEASYQMIVETINGIPPYEYSLDGGPWQTENVFNGLSSGEYTYSLLVRDQAGDTVAIGVNIASPLPLELSLASSGDVLEITPTGGTPDYVITVNGMQVFANTLGFLTPGNYVVEITDANGCTVQAEQYVTGVNTLAETASAVTPTNCAGLDGGSFALCIDGGYGALSYTIDPAEGTVEVSDTVCKLGLQVSNVSAGPYVVTVTDEEGFSSEYTLIVPDAPELQVSATVSNDTITVNASGGTGQLQYNLNGGITQYSNVFYNVPDGSYTVIVIDANLCIQSVLVTVLSTVTPADAWGLSVSPNPGSGMFMVNWQAPAELRADVYDASGRLLQQQVLPQGANAAQLDLSAYPQGLYFLRLTDGEHWGGVRLSVVR